MEIGNGSYNMRGEKSLCNFQAIGKQLFSLVREITLGNFSSLFFKLIPSRLFPQATSLSGWHASKYFNILILGKKSNV